MKPKLPNPEVIKLASLRSKPQYWAYVAARCLKNAETERRFGLPWPEYSAEEGALNIFRMFGCSAKFLKLVLDAYNDSAKFEPSTDRRRIIVSHHEATMSRAVTGTSLDVSVLVEGPTLEEVKNKFDELFPKEKRPGDETFRRAFRELKLPIRKGNLGRPPGSKDSVNRKRRKKSLES